MLEQFEGVGSAGGQQNTRSDDPTGTQHARFRLEQVHAAAAPARTTRWPGQAAPAINSRGVTPLDRACPWPRWVLNTTSSRPQVGTHSSGDRFFTNVRVYAAVDFSGRVQLHQLFFTAPDGEHVFIQR